MRYLLVFVGGGLGRRCAIVNVSCARCIGTAFPTAPSSSTSRVDRDGPDRGLSRLQGRGVAALAAVPDDRILGGYTTFSAFSLDAALLYERGESGCCLYVLGSVALSIAGLFAGLALVRHLT